MGKRKQSHSSSESDSSMTSSTSSSSSDSGYVRKRKRRRMDSESESLSSDDGSYRKVKRKKKRKHHSSVRRKRESSRKRSRKKSRKLSSSDAEDKDALAPEDVKKANTQSKLQVTMEAREQEKFLIYQNAEIAKARLSGELKQAQAEQAKMQDMYGAIDWRARKKLRMEKKKLERSIAAGKRLAQMEEEESARMDAFRVALGLPTAEAQRQAEWRAQATRALITQQPAAASPAAPTAAAPAAPKKPIIGPQLPRM